MKAIILCSCFTEPSFLIFLLWAATVLLSLLSAYTVGLCWETDVGSGTGRWLRDILGWPLGVDFEFG